MISSKYSHSNSIVSFTEHNTRGRAWTKKFWTNHVFELLTSIISWIHRYYRHWYSNPSSGDIFRGRGKSRNADSIFQVQHSQAWFLYIYMAIESCHDGNLYPSIHSIGGALSTMVSSAWMPSGHYPFHRHRWRHSSLPLTSANDAWKYCFCIKIPDVLLVGLRLLFRFTIRLWHFWLLTVPKQRL